MRGSTMRSCLSSDKPWLSLQWLRWCWWWWRYYCWWWLWWWPGIGSSNSKARKSKLGEKADNWRRIWSRYDQMRSDTYDQTNEMRSIVMKWGFQFGLASILFWIQDLGSGGLDKWMFLREASARLYFWCISREKKCQIISKIRQRGGSTPVWKNKKNHPIWWAEAFLSGILFGNW